LLISSNFHTNFYLLTGSVKTFVKTSHTPPEPFPLFPFIDKLYSPHLLKILPLINNAPFLIITSFHLFLYEYPCLWSNKSVLNWTFCQLLCWKLEPQDCLSVWQKFTVWRKNQLHLNLLFLTKLNAFVIL
jgi:hypothetical protein